MLESFVYKFIFFEFITFGCMNYSLFHNGFLLLVSVLLISCEDHTPVYLIAPQNGFAESGKVRYIEESASESVIMNISNITCTTTGPVISQISVRTYRDIYGEICGQTCRPEDNGPYPFAYIVNSAINYSGSRISLIFQNTKFAFTTPVNASYADTNVVVREENINGQIFSNTLVLYPINGDNDYDIDSVYFINDMGIMKVFQRNGKTWFRQPI